MFNQKEYEKFYCDLYNGIVEGDYEHLMKIKEHELMKAEKQKFLRGW